MSDNVQKQGRQECCDQNVVLIQKLVYMKGASVSTSSLSSGITWMHNLFEIELNMEDTKMMRIMHTPFSDVHFMTILVL